MIHIIGPHHPVPEDIIVINTTSRSDNWSRELSPFFLGPVKLYGDYVSQNVENGWQFSKVFEYYTNDRGEPDDRYFKWAQEGWADKKAHRHPMGKGIKPLYSYWNGEKLTYVEARQKIYIPLYAEVVQKTSAFDKLKKMHQANQNVYLWDFDGYNHKACGLTYQQVIENPNRKMGHAFVIGMLLEGYL